MSEHLGMIAKDYRGLLGTEAVGWGQARGAAYYATERQDWEREHSGEIYCEHECN
jgi:hypothetical protein